MDFRCNIELKCRVDSLARAERVALELATCCLGVEHQIDTYFHCHEGRLKLREINGATASLIAYDRPDLVQPRQSTYLLVDVPDPQALKAALSAALGVRVVVDKLRRIYLWENVRIHLDEVVGLGAFLEFEAVLALGDPVEQAPEQLAALSAKFNIQPANLIGSSYSDMMQKPHA